MEVVATARRQQRPLTRHRSGSEDGGAVGADGYGRVTLTTRLMGALNRGSLVGKMNKTGVRILKHLLEAEKSTFRIKLSFQRSESTTGLLQATVFVQ